VSGSIQIHIDVSEVRKKLKALDGIKGGAQKAIMRSMNKAVTGMRTDAKKEVATRYTVKQKDVSDKLTLKKASMTDLTIVMSSKGRPMRLAHFKTKANKKAGTPGAPTVYASVKKGGAGGFTGGFMATMVSTNGITGVFRRTGRFKVVGKGAYKGQMREQIEQLHGPGVVQMLDEQQVRTAIQEKGAERFNKELDHQIEFLLDKQKG
jgi:hypothetical protein